MGNFRSGLTARSRQRKRRGIAIIVVLQVLAVVLVTALALLMTTDANSNFVRLDRRSSQAFYDAEGGVRVVLKEMYDKLNGAYVLNPSNPFGVLDGYNNKTVTGTLTAPDGTSAGQYSVTCTIDPPSGGPKTDDPSFQGYKTVTLSAVGTVDGQRRSLNAVVKAGLRPAPAFQYATYINNYYYLASLYCNVVINGNVASNGNLDLLSAPPAPDPSPCINGNPIYDSSGNVVSMGGRTAAGTFNGLTGNWTGYGATYAQQRAPFIQMPSLANVSYFASQAQGTVKRGATTLVNKVFGQSGIKNIVLDGSSTPLTFTGTTVIMGDCILKGNISGQGTLFVGGNLYIAGNVTYSSYYSTRPTYVVGTDTPESYYTRLTSWMTANASKPAVAFCVANHVVIGDVSTDYWWNGFTSNGGTPVSGGISAMVNATDPSTHTKKYVDMHEDTGFDKIWGSNDATEGDGKFTVQVDNGTNVQTMDLTLSNGVAQVPSNSTIIPGTGEDVDGNQKYTPAVTQSDFLFRTSSGTATYNPTAAAYQNWSAANYTTFVTPGQTILDMNFPTELDGFYFCNHLIVGYLGNLGNITMRGGYAARQLLTLLWCAGGTTLLIEHDDRIMNLFGNVMPGVAGISATQWQDGP